ncbi:MAG TPA: type II secretion system protein GspG [Pirellulaceae bacterium]|nr:type II secretion system protein GspG [Pirellulaceae bacterium]
MSQRKHNRRSGFTLLELMLVMFILAMLAAAAGFAIFQIQKNAQREFAMTQIRLLNDACSQFKLRNGRFPSQLEDLIVAPANINPQRWGGPFLQANAQGQLEIPLDPWGMPYNYMADDQNNRVIISSNGPDLQQGTADDIPSPADR